MADETQATMGQVPAESAPASTMGVGRAAAYLFAGTWLSLSQGLGMNLVTVNIAQIPGAIGVTTNEASWLTAAYMAPNVSLALAMIKLRTQFGLRNYAEVGIVFFAAVSTLNLFMGDLNSAVVNRFICGIAASPISALSVLYVMEAFPPSLKQTYGSSLALMNTTLAMPVARLISPYLLDIQGFHSIGLLDVGLALVSVCLVFLLPLSQPQPRAKVIAAIDVLSYLLIAVGLGCGAVVLVLGRLYWWFEAPWIGGLLAVSVAAITCSVVLELNRKSPLVDIAWILSPPVLRFAAVLLLFKMLMSEQTSGASSLFQVLGLLNEQMARLYLVILLASIAGGLTCAVVMKPGRNRLIYCVALALIAVGAWLDSQLTSQTRPNDMLASQAMIAFASALFVPPAMVQGVTAALAKGPNYILSFTMVFMSAQSIGGLLGSAVFGTYVTLREKLHSNYLVEHITLSDPIVAQRVSQLGEAYAGTLTDQALVSAEGTAQLSKSATQEANVLAYNDAFQLVAIVAATAAFVLMIRILASAIGRAWRPQPRTAES